MVLMASMVITEQADQAVSMVLMVTIAMWLDHKVRKEDKAHKVQ